MKPSSPPPSFFPTPLQPSPLYSFPTPPQNVLIFRKPKSKEAHEALLDLISFFEEKLVRVFVEENVCKEVKEGGKEGVGGGVGKEGEGSGSSSSLAFLFPLPLDHSNLFSLVDLVICLGGDGTILHATSHFPHQTPPLLSINFGSLGFLSPFHPSEAHGALEKIFSGKPLNVCYRQRLNCKITTHSSSSSSSSSSPPQVYMDVALNEVAVVRSDLQICTTEIYLNSRLMTTIEADGVIISTPTGSSGYSLSAGGTILDPSMTGLQLTPISPHSLTSRPIVLRDDVSLEIKVPESSRSGGCYVSVDGRKGGGRIGRGGRVEVVCSPFLVPCLARETRLADWTESLSKCLNWNSGGRLGKKYGKL